MADASRTSPGLAGFRMPAEWEPHEATWLAWPHDPLTWVLGVDAAEDSYQAMIEALAPSERVELLVPDEATATRAQARLEKTGIAVTRYREGDDPARTNGLARLHVIDYADSWVRDTGPTVLVRDDGARIAVDWRFNAWGGKYDTLLRDDRLAAILAERAGLERWRTETVLEGGAIDTDGHGTVLTTEQCLLNPNRGPDRTRTGMEQFLSESVGAERVVWLGEGIAGDDTDGHVDDLARFVSPNRVLTAREPDPADPNHEALTAAREQLSVVTDPRGKPIEVVEVDMPDPVHAQGTRVPATYINLYVGTAVVLVPTYDDPADADALATIDALFPRRRIAPIPARALVAGFGACHCLTQQLPAPPS